MTELPLVLLSGLGFSHAGLSGLQAVLADQARVVVQPLPGTGDGTPDPEEGHEALLACLPERAHLMGWSLGGLVGMALAARAPERVASLTCLATSPHLLADGDWPGVQPEDWQPFTDLSPEGRDLASRLLMRLQGDRNVMRGLRPHVLSPQLSGWAWGLEALGTWDFREFVRSPSVPLCMLFGEQDQLLPVAVAERLGGSSPVHVLAEAPHALPFTHAAACARLWQEFQDELD